MTLNTPTLHTLAGLKIERTERSAVKTFTFFSKEIANESTPGQFVMVWDPGIDEIPISIAHASSPDGRLELAIADVGDCSHSLHQKQVGDLIGLRGPFGTGFSLTGDRICMVAGGYGAAPLRFAASRARALGKDVVVLEGAQCSSDLLYIHEFRDLGCEVQVATEDGSQGYCGMCKVIDRWGCWHHIVLRRRDFANKRFALDAGFQHIQGSIISPLPLHYWKTQTAWYIPLLCCRSQFIASG